MFCIRFELVVRQFLFLQSKHHLHDTDHLCCLFFRLLDMRIYLLLSLLMFSALFGQRREDCLG